MKKNLILLCSIVGCMLFTCNVYGQTTANDYLARGAESLGAGNLYDAILNFSKAIELDPKSAVAYNGLAASYQRQGKVEMAIVNFTKAIELNPSYKEAYFGRGVCYLKPGDYDKAIMDLSKAIQIDAKNADAYYYRGQGYFFKKEYAKSMEDVRTAEKLEKTIDPKFLEALKTSLGTGK